MNKNTKSLVLWGIIISLSIGLIVLIISNNDYQHSNYELIIY